MEFLARHPHLAFHFGGRVYKERRRKDRPEEQTCPATPNLAPFRPMLKVHDSHPLLTIRSDCDRLRKSHCETLYFIAFFIEQVYDIGNFWRTVEIFRRSGYFAAFLQGELNVEA
jgi:hypothetical protein